MFKKVILVGVLIVMLFVLTGCVSVKRPTSNESSYELYADIIYANGSSRIELKSYTRFSSDLIVLTTTDGRIIRAHPNRVIITEYVKEGVE